MANEKKWTSVSDDRIRKLGLSNDGRDDSLTRAFLILKYSHDSAEAMLEALDAVRSKRQAKKGRLTDEEQDLLRSMVVMAASGLDSVVKWLIRSALPPLCQSDSDVEGGYLKHVSGKIQQGTDGGKIKATTFLAKVLSSDQPRTLLIEDYIYELTGSSMQSADQLFKAAAALGISHKVICSKTLKPIFIARNQIIHELDINFEEARGNRRSRRKADMIRYANQLLGLTEVVYLACEEKLASDTAQ